MGAHAIAHGDVLAVLRELPSNEFDAGLCDPPYGFSFMGKKWDYDVPSVETWRELLRVLKPGAPVIAFGGTRTFHRVAVGIEDAGFELRDVLSWMYGSGFPKSLDIAKAIDKAAGHWRGRAGAVSSENPAMTGANYERTPKGEPITAAAAAWHGYGTALKPAWEPAILARKPLAGTVAANVDRWGVGGLAIDACRIGTSDSYNRAPASSGFSGIDGYAKGMGRQSDAANVGRWPANVAMDEEAGAAIDAQTGTDMRAGERPAKRSGMGFHGGEGTASGDRVVLDMGGASRFFYSAKVSTKEREWGCAEIPMRASSEIHGREQDSAGILNPRAGAQGRGGARNHHPTLKPIALARWLARLIMPPTRDAKLLVPFSGAGSEMIGALEAGWPMAFGIEGEQGYIDIAHARIAAWKKGSP